jgi:hypothetical protein
VGKSRRIEPGCVDEKPAPDGGRLVAADGEIKTVITHLAGEHRSTEHDNRSGGLGLALMGEHQSMTVDNAARGRQQGRNAGERRLEPLRLRLI